MCFKTFILLFLIGIVFGGVDGGVGNGNLTSGDDQDQGNNFKGEKYLPLVNRALQTTLLSLILSTAILFNGAVILHISRDGLKTRMVHFVLIRHVCFTDFVGACLVLPVPLVAVARGTWDLGDATCGLISTTTASVWTMHLVAVALYRADRIFAVWLPTGSYPLLRVDWLNCLLTTTWIVIIATSALATLLFGPSFNSTLALCLPNVPLVFFIIVFSGYISGLVALTTGNFAAFWKRRRKRRRCNQPSPPTTPLSRSLSFSSSSTHPPPAHRRCHSDQTATIQLQLPLRKYITKPHPRFPRRTGPMATRAIYSYSVSLGHLLLYLPSMMVVGLVKAQTLPKGVALVCGLVVYCEFIVQPAALFFLSPRLRREVWQAQ